MSIGSLSLIPFVQSIFGGGPAQEAKAPEPEAKTESPTPAASSALDIAAEYDLQHITPGQFSSLLAELKASGHLTDTDFEQLNSLRTELEQSGHKSDEPLDLLGWVRERFTAHQALAEQAAQGAPDRVDQLGDTLTLWRQRVGWLEKLDALHRQDMSDLTLDEMA